MEKIETATKEVDRNVEDVDSDRNANTSNVFSAILKKNREQFNQTFKETAIFNRRIDGALFLQVLKNYIAPIIEAVQIKVPDQSEAVALELYSIALELSIC